MPIHTIREVLTGTAIANQEGNQSLALVQKRINMPEGKRFRIKSVECFDDNGTIFSDASRGGPQQLCARLIYVTPYPITPTKSSFGPTTLFQNLTSIPMGGMGPYAGDETVLYKRLDFNNNFQGDENWSPADYILTKEFPSLPTARDNDYEWYTPHIYLTAMLWTEGGWNQDLKLSFNLKLEITNVDSVQTAMGQYKENLEAQCRTLTETVNSIYLPSSAAGRSFPMWKFGGVRPEIMVTSANALRYFNRLASAAYQEMDNVAAFRTRFKEATTMVDYDAAFGDTTTNIPNWITLMNASGVTSGPIRPYPPPAKYSGNGNTVMYDSAGNPATVVT